RVVYRGRLSRQCDSRVLHVEVYQMRLTRCSHRDRGPANRRCSSAAAQRRVNSVEPPSATTLRVCSEQVKSAELRVSPSGADWAPRAVPSISISMVDSDSVSVIVRCVSESTAYVPRSMPLRTTVTDCPSCVIVNDQSE